MDTMRRPFVNRVLIAAAVVSAAGWLTCGPLAAGHATGQQTPAQPPGVTGDVVADARALARSGQRAEAISMLQARLAANPGDLGARTLLGTVLLWEGRYDDARQALNRVLAVEADHVDALGAMAYLELWTSHDSEAEALAVRVLQRTPRDTSLMLARARALDNLNRPKEAVAVLDALLAVDPQMDSARQMRERILNSLRHWKAGYSYGYDWFGERRDPWHEHGLSLGRENRWGSAIVTAWNAQRFDTQDQQVELDL
jgi:cytochrome c-type biogenesis protein CcmH/NrfG